MKNIKIKENYLLFLIVIGLISIATYSTYALFTTSTTINNVVGFQTTLTTDSNILEYEMVTVPAGEKKIVEITVNNNYQSSLYYGAWYEIVSPLDTENISVGLYTDENSTPSSGQISAGTTLTLLVGIKNDATEEAIVNLGTVGSLTASLGLSSTRTLLPSGWSPVTADLVINNITVDGTTSATLPTTGTYTVNPNCTNATMTYDYINKGFKLSSINSNATCSPIFTTATPNYLNTYIKDTLTGTTQGDGQVVNENGYRYEGANPNNYIMFNNELWRIIGVFDETSHGQTGQYLTKIIRNDSLGGYAWDKNETNTWSTSSLYNLLNTYYYNATDGTESEYCYTYSNIVTGDCNYTVKGISTTYRTMIKNVTWHLGGHYDDGATTANMYTYERNKNKTTTGYIGLMYASDYGYSVLSSSCKRSTTLDSYNTTACAGQSWLFGKGDEWTITNNTNYSNYVFRIESAGGHLTTLGNTPSVFIGRTSRPVLYLNSSVYINSGDGTKMNPYIITS